MSLHFYFSAPAKELNELFEDSELGAMRRQVIALSMSDEVEEHMPLLFDDYYWKIEMSRVENELRFAMRPVKGR